jgi:hypothetical protein
VVVHDEYQNSFEYAIDLLKYLHLWDGGIFDSIMMQLQDILTSDSTTSYHVLDIKRLESICEFMSIVIQNSTCFEGDGSMSYHVLNNICGLQTKLRQQGQVSKQSKECKAQCSALRKVSIKLCEQVIHHNPDYINHYSDQYWEVSLQVLSTPLLLCAGYEACMTTSKDTLFLDKILTTLAVAAISISKMSISSSQDYLTTITDLLSTSIPFTDLVFFRNGVIPTCILQSYVEVPQTSQRSGKDGSATWKIQVLDTLSALLQLLTSSCTNITTNDTEVLIKINIQDTKVLIIQSLCTQLSRALVVDVLLLFQDDQSSNLSFTSTNLCCNESVIEEFSNIILTDMQTRIISQTSPDVASSLLHTICCTFVSFADMALEIHQYLNIEVYLYFYFVLVNMTSRLSRTAVFDDEIDQIGVELVTNYYIIHDIISNMNDV